MSIHAHPHLVIVGAGFGGLYAARALKHADIRITVIDRRNYHLFQPLLYQVATAGGPLDGVLLSSAETLHSSSRSYTLICGAGLDVV